MRRLTRYLIAVVSLVASLPLHCPRASSRDAAPRLLRMVASWYGPGFSGRLMACGLRFAPHLPIVASRDLPFGSLVRLARGDVSAVGIVLDRGPYVSGRDLDLSWGLALKLGLLAPGVGEVHAELLGVVPRGAWREALDALS